MPKQLIITTDISTIRPVFTQGASENIKRYTQLKKLFETGLEYQVLAEPMPAGGQKIAWHTEFEGQIIPFAKLSPQDQQIAKGRLKFQVNRMYKAAVQFNKKTSEGENSLLELFDLLDSCIEVPDYKDIYVIQKPNQENNFVIIRWGFTSDDFNAQSGLVKKLVPIKVTDIHLKAIFSTEKPAKNEKITIELLGKKIETQSDANGLITLEDIPFLTKIVAYQFDKSGERVNQHNYICDERDEYIFRIGVPVVNMNFRFVDDKGKPICNENITVEYLDKTVVYKTDNNGIVVLPEIPVATDVKCWQTPNNIQKFTCEADKGEYRYVGTQPLIRMKFKVVDNQDQIIANLPFAFEVNNQKIEKRSDANGLIELNDIEADTLVKAFQMIELKAQNEQQFVCEANKPFYTLIGIRPITSANMIFNVIDKSGKPMPNTLIRFTVDGQVYEENTDASGNIVIEEVPFNTSVKCSQIIDGKPVSENTFVCQKNQTTFTIQGVVPEIKKVEVPPVAPKYSLLQIQVVDGDKKPIPDAKVSFNVNSDITNRISDKDGNVFLSNITQGTKISVFAEFESISNKLEVICTNESEFRQIVLKKKKGCAIWIWLLALLLLLLLLAYLLRNILFPPTTIVVVDTIQKHDNVVVTPTTNGIKITVLDIDTRKAVVNAKVAIDFNGKKEEQKSDASGVALFADVSGNGDVAVVINAETYPEQRTVYEVVKEKTIYLSKVSTDVSEIPLPCDSPVNSGGFGTTIKVFDMKQPKGNIQVYFNMYQIPDDITIYNGVPSEMSESNILWKSGGPVQYSQRLYINFDNPHNCITVKIVGNDAKTTWALQVGCPTKK